MWIQYYNNKILTGIFSEPEETGLVTVGPVSLLSNEMLYCSFNNFFAGADVHGGTAVITKVSLKLYNKKLSLYFKIPFIIY